MYLKHLQFEKRKKKYIKTPQIDIKLQPTFCPNMGRKKGSYKLHSIGNLILFPDMNLCVLLSFFQLHIQVGFFFSLYHLLVFSILLPLVLLFGNAPTLVVLQEIFVKYYSKMQYGDNR